jgi:FlaG/FlaF family flagellin (archaellin)
MGGVMDMLLYKYWGWSPFRPWEHIRLQDDAYLPGVIGGANTADAPAFDLYNESRPMYGTVDDVGAVEGRARPEQETTTVRTGSNAIRFEGAGFQDIFLPVNDASITVSVYGRYDSNYTGTLPQLQVLNIPGVADQTDTMTGGANAWEQLSVTFTPTSKGIARIRLVSNDTSATGESFFDDLDIT